VNILLALVPISLILLGLAIYAFVWAVRNGQYDDLDTPALDILVDDAAPALRTLQRERMEARGIEACNIEACNIEARNIEARKDDADGRDGA
jgi:cbb3-type cytochrome oxidase maturation protein